MNALTPQFLSDMAEVQGRARQAVEPGDHQGIAFTHILQASGELWALAGRDALLLVELVAVLQLLHLYIQALP